MIPVASTCLYTFSFCEEKGVTRTKLCRHRVEDQEIVTRMFDMSKLATQLHISLVEVLVHTLAST
jgi:hypothetical protein